MEPMCIDSFSRHCRIFGSIGPAEDIFLYFWTANKNYLKSKHFHEIFFTTKFKSRVANAKNLTIIWKKLRDKSWTVLKKTSNNKIIVSSPFESFTRNTKQFLEPENKRHLLSKICGKFPQVARVRNIVPKKMHVEWNGFMKIFWCGSEFLVNC